MNFKEFITYFNEDDHKGIINGLIRSEFNTHVKMSKLITMLIDSYEYLDIGCQQSGLPLDHQIKCKKMSLCTSLNDRLDNILTVFNYEFSKYMVFKLNAVTILNKILESIETLRPDQIRPDIELFNRIYLYSQLELDNEFINEYLLTNFYKFHQVVDVKGILNKIVIDVSKTYTSTSARYEVKNEVMSILKMLIKHSRQPSTIKLTSIDDILIDLDKYDIGYDGSFWLEAYELYKLDTNRFIDKTIQHYNLNQVVDNELVPQLVERSFYELISGVEAISSNKNHVKITITDTTLRTLSDILICYFVNYGLTLTKLYEYSIGFDKSYRLHFKLLITAFRMNIIPYHSYSSSQMALIHYCLVTDKDLLKCSSTSVSNEPC